jgi:hypothetical protein
MHSLRGALPCDTWLISLGGSLCLVEGPNFVANVAVCLALTRPGTDGPVRHPGIFSLSCQETPEIEALST